MKKAIVLIIVLAILGYAGYRFYKHQQGTPVQAVAYRTARISKGDIVQEITATGIVQPIKEVEVATQVTGKVTQLLADYNSQVTEGEKIATIDPDTYEAALASAKARLKSSEASLERTKAHLSLAEKELVRQQKLAEKKMNSEADLDNAVATRDQLLADMKSNEASIEECKASLRQAKTNLDYCTIISPVTGIVISRSVDEGQTVVSSMNASPLYTIATDLNRVQVEASVPEADIGQVKVGQTVNFTVDAYKEKFTGKVVQIRLAATTVSNVVTYPVIVEAENPGAKLFPGMTANLSIIIEEARDIVLIPAAALRFKPEQSAGPGAMPPSAGMPGSFPPPAAPSEKTGNTVWVLDEANQIKPVSIELGISDGVNQQVLDGSELIDRQVVIGVQKSRAAGSSGSSNPFTPKMPSRNKNSQKGAGAPPQK